MKKEFVRNPYNYDSDQVSEDTGLKCLDESRTEQQHVAEADINYIANRFMSTGELPQVLEMPLNNDFNVAPDFQTAMNLIAKAKQEFMELPAKLRTRFNHDPGQLIAFMEDPENRDEAIKLGFIEKPAIVPAPTTTGVTHETRSERGADHVPKERAGTQGTTGDAGKTQATQEPRSETGKGNRGGNTG